LGILGVTLSALCILVCLFPPLFDGGRTEFEGGENPLVEEDDAGGKGDPDSVAVS
jgi:hypothetical protein